MTVNKDETVRILTLALVALVAGGGAGLGTSNLTGGGEVTVKLSGPIKAELPPDQMTLLRDQAALAPAVDRLDRTMASFFADYREDQAEQRRIYDAIMGKISDLTQRMGMTEREIKTIGGQVQDHTERLRQLERIGPVPMIGGQP